jgi:hypothetical protein
MIENYKCKFKSRGKWIFEPNERCVEKGRRILGYFKGRIELPCYYFHYAKGGHVAALHAHLKNRFFFKIDIKKFFYSISRNRVVPVLLGVGGRGMRLVRALLAFEIHLGVAARSRWRRIRLDRPSA